MLSVFENTFKCLLIFSTSLHSLNPDFSFIFLELHTWTLHLSHSSLPHFLPCSHFKIHDLFLLITLMYVYIVCTYMHACLYNTLSPFRPTHMHLYSGMTTWDWTFYSRTCLWRKLILLLSRHWSPRGRALWNVPHPHWYVIDVVMVPCLGDTSSRHLILWPWQSSVRFPEL